MADWKNLDTLASFKKLEETKRVDLAAVMSAEAGAERVKKYSVPMAEGLQYNYAAKAVDDDTLKALRELALEAQLSEKFEELYNGAVINTGEKRLVLHQLCRGQLGRDVVADGVNKRAFYEEQQKRIADFANKVHSGEIVNENGEKFTSVVQIGIGGSDLGPRAMYIALENWAKATGNLKMSAKFISNVDPDDAAAVLASTDVAHAVFILVYMVLPLMGNEKGEADMQLFEFVIGHFMHYLTSGILGWSYDVDMGIIDKGDISIILSPFINLFNFAFGSSEPMLSPVNQFYYNTGIALTNVRTFFGTLYIYTDYGQFTLYALTISFLLYVLKAVSLITNNIYLSFILFYYCGLLAMGWFEFYFFHLSIIEVPVLIGMLAVISCIGKMIPNINISWRASR